MKTMNVKRFLTASFLLTCLLAAGSAVAQEERRPGPPVACPHPVTLVITNPPPVAPAPDPADFGPPLASAVAGSVWNQTAVNKAFGHTFHFPAPVRGECCLMTKGTLEVTIKCLQGGPAGSATSANDYVELVQGAASVPGYTPKAWPTGCSTGAVHNVMINNIPASILSTGRVSFYVEDDTAVLSAKLTLEGCCLK